MGRSRQSPQMAAVKPAAAQELTAQKRTDLTQLAAQALSFSPPAVDLSQRVIYFPVRHHSPACAWHVDRLLREVQPAAVLIEAPRDATPLVPLLVMPETAMPVAIYATYVRREKEQPIERHAAYYPLCDFSPELAAIKAGLAVNAVVEFIDLTFPEKIVACDQISSDEAPGNGAPHAAGPLSLQDEGWLTHSRLLKAACIRTGARDPDDLWDHLYEVDYRGLSSAEFIANVLTYCALARYDHTPQRLAADGTLAREQAMAAAIARYPTGRIVVVTGGFHTVALPTTEPAMPPPLKIAADDHQVVLMRYSFEQLDRLNGYASGMPSPEFYQRMWEDQSAARILVEIARECRRKNLGTSTSDAIAAVAHAQRLADLRGHARPSRANYSPAIGSGVCRQTPDSRRSCTTFATGRPRSS
jgi:hypothetical protein